MKEEFTISYFIKRYITMRGRTLKETADAVGEKYSTFCGILKRDAVDAKLLFALANYLDMDLTWMSQLFDHSKPISPLTPYQMPRMQSDFRKTEYPKVQQQLDYCIRNNPNSIADAKKELIKSCMNLFYLLDVLMPEENIIRITVERGKETYYCIEVNNQRTGYSGIRGRSLEQFLEGNEMLNHIIASRKEHLL